MIFLFLLVVIIGTAFGFIYWQVQQANAQATPAEVLAYHAEERKYFEGIHSPTVNELADVLREAGFNDAASAVEHAWQPCFRFVPTPEEDASPRTRVGGDPDLPDIALWPHGDGVPLSFLAQIDLAELSELIPDTPLPKAGLLSFFYDADQRAWGFKPEDRESWRVLYFPNPFTPVPLDTLPEGMPEHGRYAQATIMVETGESLPDDLIDSFLDDKSDRESAMLEDIMDQYQQCYEGAAHQVLGFPCTIQGDMRLECQLASNGLYCGDESGYKDPRAKALEPGAEDWQLLLQLDTDDRAGMLWGDLGTLYFWIKKQDLAEGRFDQAWMVLQCT